MWSFNTNDSSNTSNLFKRAYDSDDEVHSKHMPHHIIHEEDGETSSVESGQITPWMDLEKEEILRIAEEKASNWKNL